MAVRGRSVSAEECIKCEGCWFAPSAFEDFGGKGSSKKWKASIFYENKSLQFWFEVRLFGHLCRVYSEQTLNKVTA